MPAPQCYHHTLANGLTLLAERMDHVRSASLYFLVPAGYAHDPADQLGMATLLAEMITRGAGDRTSQELSLALDNLGADRSESVGAYNLVLSAGTLARTLPAVLGMYADILQRPHLPDEELESAQELSLQDILGLEDSPQEKVMLELKSRYYPAPFDRSRYGTTAGVEAVTPDSLRDFYSQRVRPDRAILSVAGAIDWPQLMEQVERLFSPMEGKVVDSPALAATTPTSAHVGKESEQTQIALAFPSATIGDPDFYACRGAVGVLSGGMSARLFTEVREKRGLCYSVYASHESLRDRGTVLGYAGTRADRAQETLDVMLAEFARLREGIATDEVDRVKASLKTSLVMQQESTGARASSMASDWFYLNRVRSVDEIQAAIDQLTPKRILEALDRYPFTRPTVVTLGPKPLVVPTA